MANHRGKPVLGYPTQTAAITALLGEGKTPQEAAHLVGCSLQTVYTTRSQLKQKGTPATEPDMPPGIWTPTKLAKARRLFGKSMIMIAEALQVPAKELLEYGLKGVIPPMGEGQRVAQLLEDLAGAPEPEPAEADAPQLALPPPNETQRAADEAELAAFVEDDDPEQAAPRPTSLADEIAEAARAREPETVPAPQAVAGRADPMAVPMAASVKARFRLRNEAGEYLNENERSMTRLPKFFWRGTADEVKHLKRKKPHLRQLIEETATG